MRKTLALFLSVYILALTTIPCLDRPENYAMQETILTQTTNSEHHCDNDQCSPFCTCNCCTSPITTQLTEIQFCCYTTTQDYSTPYFLEQVPSVSTSVWQPPKIS